MANNSFVPMRRIMAILVSLVIVILSFNTESAHAAESKAPAVPEFGLKVSDDESVFTFTISKTQNADGYRIYAKEPGSTKYRTVATIKKNGNSVRTYTYSPFNPGKYTFRIKAYSKNGKKKVWSKVSATQTVTVKSDILSRVPVKIRFAKGTRTEIVAGSSEPGGTDQNRYVFEYECDEGLEKTEIRLFIVNSDGTRAKESPFLYYEKELSIGAFSLGECYAVLYAFGSDADVDFRNPLARSEKIKLSCMDKDGNTSIKYNDITFKDGLAYYGLAPTEYITDEALKTKLKAAPKDHDIILYNGDRYRWDDVGPFKYVPAEWRILEQTEDYVLLMRNSISDGGGYDGWREAKTTTWATSCMYYMLNRSHEYTKEEKTFCPMLDLGDERSLIEIDILGTKCKMGIPTVEMLTNSAYGFSTSTAADSKRIVTPAKNYELTVKHNATRPGYKLYGMYWVANEKAGQTICVDQKGKIVYGPFEPNVYEVGVVEVIKVNLKACNVYYK